MENYSTLLTEFRNVNAFTQTFLEGLPCDINDLQDLCVNSFLEMIRSSNSTLELIFRFKYLKDAQIIIRTQIERLIKLKKLSADPDFVIKFINQTQGWRLRFAEIAIQDTPEAKGNPLYDALKQAIDSKLVEELKNDKKSNGDELSLWEIARQAGLLQQYYLPYRLYSDPAHAAAVELDDCISEQEGEISLIPYGSKKLEDLPETLMLAINIALNSICIVGHFKGINVEEQLKKWKLFL